MNVEKGDVLKIIGEEEVLSPHNLTASRFITKYSNVAMFRKLVFLRPKANANNVILPGQEIRNTFGTKASPPTQVDEKLLKKLVADPLVLKKEAGWVESTKEK